ncbi:response regulator transcription factor [Sphingorhabdus sp. Alg239-R122]|uniref:response regulator n=1 Tax=Sphingorhabdus sp. Alg239-R122 TaxID=2305989 RepID=UPI0013DB0532|nr:response regulator transcription factor [Sphingorhabdus sp. Alg239-R122]
MTDQTHILLIDDEPSIRQPLTEYLERQNMRVTEAENASKARSEMRKARFDIALLDIMMPGEDGLSLCRHISETADMPVILLTAKGEATDRIIGLEIGADDYVVKPFDPRELVARIKTVLRRAHRTGQVARDAQVSGYEFDGWLLDTIKHQLTDPEGVHVPISAAEYRLLNVFAEHAGQVLNRDQLLDMVQGREANLFDRAIDNQVSRLRKKIEADSKNPELIQTVWGGGYMLAANVTQIIADERS